MPMRASQAPCSQWPVVALPNSGVDEAFEKEDALRPSKMQLHEAYLSEELLGDS